jgi:NAD(P)-dependent dehydrogenase (short-subunit alcohol dehydrogenase family)
MTANLLQQEHLNAIIVGNGALGTALAGSLLERSELQQLVILQRSIETSLDDPRVTIVGFDAEQPCSVTAAAMTVRKTLQRAHLMINTVGMLHNDQQQPEKRLRSLEPENLQRSFAINATLLPVLVQAFGELLRHDEAAIFASLSARVGSIEDNHLGGWYSYRASKAAHNMLLRTIAHEWRMSHRNAAIVALHPGTVASPLSAPFITSGYKHPVRSPSECAESLLQVLSNLPPEPSGQFYDWQGKIIPW